MKLQDDVIRQEASTLHDSNEHHTSVGMYKGQMVAMKSYKRRSSSAISFDIPKPDLDDYEEVNSMCIERRK